MRKQHLLVAASALLIGFGVSGHAFAETKGPKGDPKPITVSLTVGLADSTQSGEVDCDTAIGTDAYNGIDGSFNGAKGMINVQQNGGANSLQQSDNTLAAILDGSASKADLTGVGAIALSSQTASVVGDSSVGAFSAGKTVSKSEKSGGWSFDTSAGVAGYSDSSSTSGGKSGGKGGKGGEGGIGPDVIGGPGGGDSSSSNHKSSGFVAWDSTEASGGYSSSAFYLSEYLSAVQSANSISGSFNGAVGMINVSQNVGNNSLQQTSNTAAAILGH